MNGGIRDFKDLIVWQKAMQLAQGVYRVTQRFPRDEQYVLTAQVRRAAISVPSNIAEGHTRQGREFAHFLSIARGSLAEVECQLLLGVGLGYLKAEDLREANALIPEIRRMCIALARKCAPNEGSGVRGQGSGKRDQVSALARALSPDSSLLTPDP